MIRGSEFSIPAWSLERGESLKVELITNGQLFHQSSLSNEASVKKPTQRGFGELLGWWAHERARWVTHEEKVCKGCLLKRPLSSTIYNSPQNPTLETQGKMFPWKFLGTWWIVRGLLEFSDQQLRSSDSWDRKWPSVTSNGLQILDAHA